MIDVRGMSWGHWVAATTILIAQYGFIPKPGPEKDWRTWAMVICGIPKMGSLDVPWPDRFPDWQSWGRQFNQQMRLTGN